MKRFILPLEDKEATLEMVGGKGASLARLKNAGLPVPDGFHISTDAYRMFVKTNQLQPVIESVLDQVDLDVPSSLETASSRIQQAFVEAAIPQQIAAEIASAYADLQGADPSVAVRSSATAEDLPEASFAGQQETYLNVSGAGAVLDGVRRCWASLWTARAIRYRAQQDIDTDGAALAVVVQLLVPAEAAGVMFTMNVISGSRKQMQISAAWGLGDAVVGGRVTPDDYLVEKTSRKVLQRTAAEKEVMTVRVDGGSEDQPVPENLRNVPVLTDENLKELTGLGVKIEELFGMPVDIEWAMADSRFYILQARPITALPDMIVPPPDEWELPEGKGRYMRGSIIDMMPEPLSPLFAAMGLNAYNAAMEQMMRDVTGANSGKFPADIVTTIQTYAYMKVNYSAGEWWDMLFILGPKLKKLIQVGPRNFREEALPRYKEVVQCLEQKDVKEMSGHELWSDARELTYAALYFLALLQVYTLGAAAGSEGLFSALYNRFYNDEEKPDASAFLMGHNTIPMQADKAVWDMAMWAKDHETLREYLLSQKTGRITADLAGTQLPAGITHEIWQEWVQKMMDYRREFGYILYDLDFARSIPAEDPGPALEVLKIHLRGEGANPYERQEKLERQRLEAVANLKAEMRGLRGWAVRKALKWVTNTSAVREDSIASIGIAYPRIRILLRELGRRLNAAGVLMEPDDIYWLEEAEIEKRLENLNAGRLMDSMEDQISHRKEIIRAAKKHLPPTQIPYSKTYMGIPLEVFVPGEGGQEGNQLKGVGASTGRVTGTARVLHGPEDFDQMRQGDILVAKLTTPAWTPLFTMASAVVTDIGGPLSHGSIVAREYGIPAVMGTVAATRVIQNGQVIQVDGDAGLVTLTVKA
ncbi:MAG: hypothetical protein JXA25_09255 [Anaerolineales bacterium]|nr:hypothetical protein [Anaerolineales bacterium]